MCKLGLIGGVMRAGSERRLRETERLDANGYTIERGTNDAPDNEPVVGRGLARGEECRSAAAARRVSLPLRVLR